MVTGFLSLDDSDFEIQESDTEINLKISEADDDSDTEDEDDDDNGMSMDADSDDSSLDPEEVKARFDEIQSLFDNAKKMLEKHGRNSEKAKAAYDELATRFMLLKLNNRLSDQIMALMREVYEDVRTTERQIMRLVIRKGKMPLDEFKKTFPSNETNIDWLAHRIDGKPAFAGTLEAVMPDVVALQKKILAHEKTYK